MQSENQYMDEGPAPKSWKDHNLTDYLRWVLRYIWIFLITVIGGYILGQYIAANTPPTYKSQATIEVLRFKKADAEVDEDEAIRSDNWMNMQSAAEKLTMPHLYKGIAASPLFANRENVSMQRFTLPWQSTSEYSSADLSPAELGGMMNGWVRVHYRKNTVLLDISATHSDPEIARDVLIGLLKEYERSVESKVTNSSEHNMRYILKSSTDVKGKMLTLERALRLYNRCSELTLEIRSAEKQVSEMEKRYLPKWPALVEGKQLVTILKKSFHDELLQVISLSEEEQAFWAANAALLGQLKEEALVNAQIQLVTTRSSVLTRELDAEQQMYDNLLTKLKEGNISKGFESKEFDIIQPPSLPGWAFAPNKQRILATYTLGGGALGVGIILLLGFLDPTVRTVTDLESLTSLPVIGAMPSPKKGKGERTPNSLVLANEEENHQAAEAIRTFRAGLTFLGDSAHRKTFLVTSALPGEGKSWVASNLALSFALQGDRTLLLDADLRRPVQGIVFGYDKKAEGFSDFISLNPDLKKIIRKSKHSENLFVLPAGSHSANPSELLSGKNLSGKIEELGNYFTRIVIDSAPLIPVSDTLPIAKHAQSLVLVCRVGKTPRGAIKRALKILDANQTRPVGIVANGLPKTRSKSGYGYYYSYYGGSGYGAYGGYGSEESEES